MQRASVRLGLLRRLACLGRPFTKPCNLPDDPREGVARRDRNYQRLTILCWDRLGRLRVVIVVRHLPQR